MPSRASLCVGDKIRLLCIPEADLRQRERELRDGVESPGWTADTIERIIAINAVVVIARIDEYGAAWFDVELPASDSFDQSVEEHTLAIMEDESWERVNE